MIVAIGVGLLGLVLIYLEFFVPGGILGTLGGVAFILSAILFAWEAGHLWMGVVFIGVMVCLLLVSIRLALWKLKKKPALFASDAQSGYVASSYDASLIGKEGEALTDLKPSGHIMVEGERYQAVSESRYIKKGEPVKIIGGEGARLICK
ncbi:MAG: serine protease [Chlamydiia bacterium]|nr:serine protease [Chlamydiia bacterium]